MKRYLSAIFTIIMLLSISVMGQNNKYGSKVDLEIEVPEGAKPWTSLDLNNDPGSFQFAIVTDRTGGLRPGIFAEGVKRLNLLQPEFVMSVGDLITGYTEDLVELNRQWDEFDAMVDQLDMPFFYVPGNHDITNKVMEDLYLERVGPTNYFFKYKDVLFMCLNSEDQYRGASRGTISDVQYDWIKKTLEEHSDVKWTMVFMHQPLWLQRAETLRWNDVEALLSDRQHSVFVGHRHHYVKYERNNGNYFMLATTGGGSRLRGPEFGEFDHVVWITMTEAGPIMANIQLEGIHNDGVVTENTWDFISEMGRRSPIEIEPLYVDKSFSEGSMNIKLTNDSEVPMMVKLQNSFSFSYKSDLDNNKVEIQPNSVAMVKLDVGMRKNRAAENAAPIQLTAKVSHMAEDMPKIEVPYTFNVSPLERHFFPMTNEKMTVDGNLSEWKDLPYAITVDEEASVSGNFGITMDDQYVYVAAKVNDNEVFVDAGTVIWRQDYIGVALNADPIVKSAADRGDGWYRNSFYVQGTPEKGDVLTQKTEDENLPEGTQWSCKATADGYVMETAIPIDYIKSVQGDNWRTARINITIQDRDEGMTRYPRYYWQPEWRSGSNIIGSGMFFRK